MEATGNPSARSPCAGNLARMLNSNESFRIDDSFTFSLVIVRALPQGGGKRKRKHVTGLCTASDFAMNKRYIFKVPATDDNLCCAKSLILALRYLELTHIQFYNRYRQAYRNGKPFRREAQLLQEQAGIPIGTLCGPDELKQFTAILPDYRLLVVDAERCYEIYAYGNEHSPQCLVLYHHNGHYDAVVKLGSLFSQNYFCWDCLHPYDNRGQHACQANQDHCPRCRLNGCTDFLRHRQGNNTPTDPYECRRCHRVFYGPTCMEQHRVKDIKGDEPTDLAHTVC